MCIGVRVALADLTRGVPRPGVACARAPHLTLLCRGNPTPTATESILVCCWPQGSIINVPARDLVSLLSWWRPCICVKCRPASCTLNRPAAQRRDRQGRNRLHSQSCADWHATSGMPPCCLIAQRCAVPLASCRAVPRLTITAHLDAISKNPMHQHNRAPHAINAAAAGHQPPQHSSSSACSRFEVASANHQRAE